MPSARVEIEDRFPRAILQDLTPRGHKFQKIGRKGEVRYGYAAAVVVDSERREVQGGAEPRRSHGAIGAAGRRAGRRPTGTLVTEVRVQEIGFKGTSV